LLRRGRLKKSIMKKWIVRTLCVFIVTSNSTPSSASFYCSEPREPSCVDGSGYFDDSSEFESCKSDVESFVSDTKEYVSCLTDASNEAIQASNKAVEQFNCRAEGKSYC
jgi:hypothetical protein